MPLDVDTHSAATVSPALAGLRASTSRELQNTARIMIVDDEPFSVKVLRRHLEVAGYVHFLSLCDPCQALEVMRTHQPDLLFLDILMPNVSGLDILSEMQRDPALSHIPVIVLTASTEHQNRIDALSRGAHDFLQKPVELPDLLPRTRNALMIRSYMNHVETHGEKLEVQVLTRTRAPEVA